MSNFLITGGAGFIGSNLAERLIRDGHKVTIIDNLMTGSENNIPAGTKYLGQSFSINQIWNIPIDKEAGVFDGIFHLGVPSSTPMYRTNRYYLPLSMLEYTNLMEYAKAYKIRVVYASTSSIYNGCALPSNESMAILPTDFYTELRYYFERLARVYHDFYGVKSIGLRFYGVYGPREYYKHKYANMVTQLLWAAQKGEVFEIYGDGEQKRDFTYVSDVVDALILAMYSTIECDIFNVGTGTTHTINEVIKLIGTKIKYVPVPIKNYVMETFADTTKARDSLGFSAQISLKKGLRLMQKEGTKPKGAV